MAGRPQCERAVAGDVWARQRTRAGTRRAHGCSTVASPASSCDVLQGYSYIAACRVQLISLSVTHLSGMPHSAMRSRAPRISFSRLLYDWVRKDLWLTVWSPICGMGGRE